MFIVRPSPLSLQSSAPKSLLSEIKGHVGRTVLKLAAGKSLIKTDHGKQPLMIFTWKSSLTHLGSVFGHSSSDLEDLFKNGKFSSLK